VCHAAFERLPADARALGLCESNTASASGFVLSTNPALLGLKDRAEFSGYSARLYGQTDLTQVSCEVKLRRIGLLASSFGGPLYRESVLAIGFGTSMDGLIVGFSGKIMNLSIQGYGSGSAVGLDVGATGAVNSRLLVAASAKNINMPTIGSDRDELPVDMDCGLAYTPSEGLLLCFSLREESGMPPCVSAGIELELNRLLLLRAGSSPQHRGFAGGLGLRLSGFSVDYGVAAHEALGLTQGMSVCYTVSGR